MGHDRGDGVVNLCLAVLLEAKKSPSCTMWRDLGGKIKGHSHNVNPLAIAELVGDFFSRAPVSENEVKICPSCNREILDKGTKCDLCGATYEILISKYPTTKDKGE